MPAFTGMTVLKSVLRVRRFHRYSMISSARARSLSDTCKPRVLAKTDITGNNEAAN